jgi:hypothetical protein
LADFFGMRATCLPTHHRPVNEKPFKIGLNLQKNVQIHPLSWEKTQKHYLCLLQRPDRGAGHGLSTAPLGPTLPTLPQLPE